MLTPHPIVPKWCTTNIESLNYRKRSKREHRQPHANTTHTKAIMRSQSHHEWCLKLTRSTPGSQNTWTETVLHLSSATHRPSKTTILRSSGKHSKNTAVISPPHLIPAPTPTRTPTPTLTPRSRHQNPRERSWLSWLDHVSQPIREELKKYSLGYSGAQPRKYWDSCERRCCFGPQKPDLAVRLYTVRMNDTTQLDRKHKNKGLVFSLIHPVHCTQLATTLPVSWSQNALDEEGRDRRWLTWGHRAQNEDSSPNPQREAPRTPSLPTFFGLSWTIYASSSFLFLMFL